MCKPVDFFFLPAVKRANGLGLGATLKSKPKPEKARLCQRKPVLQADKLTLLIDMIARLIGEIGKGRQRSIAGILGVQRNVPRIPTVEQ
jgi:hypothetical protein